MDLTTVSTGAYNIAIFLIVILVPTIIALFALRVITRSTRKTVKVFKKK